MLNNVPLHGDTDANLMGMPTTRMRMLTLMLMLVMRTIFGAIIKVWEVIKIMVIMILFAKAKFTMLSFAGTADQKAYLDWELAVEQTFSSC